MNYCIMSFMYKFLCVIALLSILACSSEKSSETKDQKAKEGAGGAVSERAQTASLGGADFSVEIKPVPSDATRKSTLYLTAQGFAPAEAIIEWLVNGAPIAGQSALQFKAVEIKKGDKVQAKAVIKGREILSSEVQIKNSPPAITKVKFVNEGLKPGDVLGVETSAEDLDGDEVTFTYEWTKNGEPLGNGRSISGPLKRGDKLSVKITPFDGEAYGYPVTLGREITNLPPVITEHKNLNFDGKVFIYQVKASDPDGDILTYSLKDGPNGMTIDPSTGLVKWNVSEDFKGKASFTVSVSDGQGGEATQKMSVEIKRSVE